MIYYMGCWISNHEKPDYETILCFDLFDNNQMADWYPVALLFMTDILLFFVFHISMRQSHPNNSLFYWIDFVVQCNLISWLLGFKRWEPDYEKFSVLIFLTATDWLAVALLFIRDILLYRDSSIKISVTMDFKLKRFWNWKIVLFSN